MVRKLAIALAAAAVLLVAAPRAHADAYLRVITQTAPVHTGPGPDYRQIYTAMRGDVFPVHERGSESYWFKVELEDGTMGWIYGELVFPFEVVEDTEVSIFTRAWRATRRAIFAPSPVPSSSVELSFSAGALDREGVFIFRPAYLIDKYFAVEAFAGLSPRKDDDLYLYGAGWTFRLVPGSTLGPHVFAGLGGATSQPKADVADSVVEQQTLFALSVGGGFELTFKKQITVRIDFRNWTIFDPDKANNGQEYSGGLAIFF